MKTTPIPIVPIAFDGQPTQMVDARLLHRFLEVGRDFTNWIKGRINEYGFVEGEDYLILNTGGQDFSPNLAKNHRGRGRPGSDYYLTLDMAKELAMVERTDRGRQARRYFIECERQLARIRQGMAQTRPAAPLTCAERQAINRQAWAEVTGQAYAMFHDRREALLREYQSRGRQDSGNGCIPLPEDFTPAWAR